eukprot:c10856_g1_i1.p1 GENE.c10856_g1_i1~~c10856_g1_i1.p1  ORF type:complete len:2723 (-),score=370.65 c10856_g1_i1:1577-8719(-)
MDLFLGVSTLQGCQDICRLGVSNCKDSCTDQKKGGTLACNAIMYSTTSKQCQVHSGCTLSTETQTQFSTVILAPPVDSDGDGKVDVVTSSPTVAPTLVPFLTVSATVSPIIAILKSTTTQIPVQTSTLSLVPSMVRATVSATVFVQTAIRSPLPQASLKVEVPVSKLSLALYADTMELGDFTRWTSRGDADGFVKALGTPKVATQNGLQALILDGASAIQHKTQMAPALMTGGAPRTVEVWVKLGAVPTQENTLVAWGTSGATLRDSALTFWSNPVGGSVRHGGTANDMGWWGGASVRDVAGTANAPPSTQDWLHVVYTYSGSDASTDSATARVYSNGTLQSERSKVLLSTLGTKISIGSRVSVGSYGETVWSQNFVGAIHAIRFWPNYAMPIETVADLCKAGPTSRVYPPDVASVSQPTQTVTSPTRRFGFITDLPDGTSSLEIETDFIQTSSGSAEQTLVLVGGDGQATCGNSNGGSLYVGTSSTGCPTGNLKVVFGVQCDQLSSSRLETPCTLLLNLKYAVRAQYKPPFATIFVNNKQVAAGMKVFVVAKTDPTNGFQVSLLSASHQQDLNVLGGSLSNTRVMLISGPASTASITVTASLSSTVSNVPTQSPTSVPSVSFQSSAVLTAVPTPSPTPSATPQLPKSTTATATAAAGNTATPTQTPLPTKNSACVERPVAIGRFPNSVVGAVSGCNNDFPTSGFTDVTEHCAYRCSLDSTCNFFWVFSKEHSIPGRCCMQQSFNPDANFTDNSGIFYTQICSSQKPEAAKTQYPRHLFKPFDSITLAIIPSATSQELKLLQFDVTDTNQFFQITPALNEQSGAVSLIQAAQTHRFIRDLNGVGVLATYDGSATFDDEVSFLLEVGLNNKPNTLSFRSTVNPKNYLFHSGSALNIGPIAPSDTAANSASWVLDPVLSGIANTFPSAGGKFCITFGKRDSLVGVSLEACKLACNNGVADCKDSCASNFTGGGDPCNAIWYNSQTKFCMTYTQCAPSSTNNAFGFELFPVSKQLPAPISQTCRICDPMKEVMTAECTSIADRQCDCKVGFAGAISNCQPVSCTARATQTSDLSKCVCDVGFTGGPFNWVPQAATYETGVCLAKACPSRALKSQDGSQCLCQFGDVGGPFNWDPKLQKYDDSTASPCTVAQCPDKSGGTNCSCFAGYISSVGSDTGVFIAGKGWNHTCAPVACPTGTVRTTNGDSCTCAPGSSGRVEWIDSTRKYVSLCQKIDCPQGTMSTSRLDVCQCVAGFAGQKIWSESSGTFEGTCDPVKCPSFTDPVGTQNCACKAGTVGECFWTGFNFNCTCRTSGCPAFSVKPDVNSLCQCLKGYSGTLIWDDKSQVYSGACKFVACPAFAVQHPECTCGQGYKTAAFIDWSPSTQKFSGSCQAVSCPANSDNSTFPVCACSSGFKYANNTAIRWNPSRADWDSSCTAIPCPTGAGNNPPNCACQIGYISNNLHLEEGLWDGSCQYVPCPSAGVHPNCKCPTGFTGVVRWEGVRWVERCTPVVCAPPSIVADSPGQCVCPAGYSGTCSWDFSTSTYSCDCGQIACPADSARDASSNLCKCTQFGVLTWSSSDQKYSGGCSQFAWTRPTTESECRLSSIGHVETEMIAAAEGKSFDVHGTDEWIVTAGPFTTSSTVPPFQVQVTTSAWMQRQQSNTCVLEQPSVVVFKDVAIKCGDFSIVYQAPKHILNDALEGCNHSPVAPKLFVTGSSPKFSFAADEIYSSATNGSVIATADGSLFLTDLPCQKGCSNVGIPSKLKIAEIDFICGDVASDRRVALKIVGYCASSGGCYTDLSVDVPPATNGGVIKDSTLAGGLCGGWDSTIESDLAAQHASCRKQLPFSFFNQTSPCRSKFTTKSFNSLFRKFEDTSAGKKTAYDSVKFVGDAAQTSGDNGEPERPTNSTRMDQMAQACVVLRQKIDPRANNTLNPLVPMDAMLLALQQHCRDDMYFNVDWTVDDMANQICNSLAVKIRFEREDVKCASSKLAALSTLSDTIIATDSKACSSCNPARIAALTVQSNLASITNLVNEVAGSIDAIKTMSLSTCTGRVPATAVNTLDCTNHIFRNTSSWSCGQPVPPPQADWKGSCSNFDQGASCSSECISGYTRQGTGSGVTTCEKRQVGALADVLVEMQWSAPSLTCRVCYTCDATSNEVTLTNCTSLIDTTCGCKPGYAGIASKLTAASKCTICPAGKFSTNIGAASCSDCPPNTYSEQPGQTSCKACTVCGPGEVLKTPCDGISNSVCQCAPGFAGVPGNCTACGGTSYSDKPGLTNCKACSTCNLNTEGAVSVCTPTSDTVCLCKAGFAGPVGSCKQCQAGFSFASTLGAANCKECGSCNADKETQIQACSVTSDTVCRCKSTLTQGNENCFQVFTRTGIVP